jgi:hypothetical protein
MCKIVILLYFFIVIALETGNAQNRIEIRSYPSNVYDLKDSLVFFAIDKKDSVDIIWFSLEVIYENDWRELDNDIYNTRELKSIRYFYLKKSKIKRFCFYLKNIDPEIMKHDNVSIRIVLNTYPTWFRSSEQIPFNAFMLKK